MGELETTWRRYISAHGLEPPTFEDESEEARYASIRVELAELERERKEDEDAILRRNMVLSRWQSGGKGTDLGLYRGRLRYIADEAARIQQSREGRQAANHRHMRAQSKSECSFPRLYGKTKVRFGDVGAPDAVEAEVATSLYRAWYYHGHEGGDYIFRHTGSSEQDCSPPTSSSEKTEEPRFEFPSSDDAVEFRDSFVYCGQVPRPLREYTQRMEVVFPALIRTLGSIFAVFPGAGGSDDASVKEERLLGQSISAQALHDLCECWGDILQNADKAPLEWARAKVRSSERALEFVHLLPKMRAVGLPEALKPMLPVIRVLERVTGWAYLRLVDEADLYTARRATHLLFEERKLDNILIFQTRKDENTAVSISPLAIDVMIDRRFWGQLQRRGRVLVGWLLIRDPASAQLDHFALTFSTRQDIHQFYSDDVFLNAPNHPSRVYTRLDLRDALDVFQKLHRDIDSDDTVATLEEADDTDLDLDELDSRKLSDIKPRIAQVASLAAVEALLYGPPTDAEKPQEARDDDRNGRPRKRRRKNATEADATPKKRKRAET
ncbi:hypothetical protein O9K51_00216 [Purpureocillium lavendulum]|uniref:Uncharacterized protein n=1 Tax=Purpureocillium lavendulum TaxID=1247861 RepID=A0AB34G5G1_9HYPO|nr:hypothetical protein O9K51_00216 [Purpureocillium lavendulum]